MAKAEGNVPLAVGQFGQLVQTVLAERFRLTARRETRELLAYALVVGARDHGSTRARRASFYESG